MLGVHIRTIQMNTYRTSRVTAVTCLTAKGLVEVLIPGTGRIQIRLIWYQFGIRISLLGAIIQRTVVIMRHVLPRVFNNLIAAQNEWHGIMFLGSDDERQSPNRVAALCRTISACFRSQRINKLKRSGSVSRDIVIRNTLTARHIPYVMYLTRYFAFVTFPYVMVHIRVLRNTGSIFERHFGIELTGFIRIG